MPTFVARIRGLKPVTDNLTPEVARQRMLDALDAVGADYKLYVHRPIRNYDDAELARQESGFEGTESKSMVLKSGDDVFVYMTLAGQRVDMKGIRAHLGGPKPKIVGDEELMARFAAEPGAAYPFGFGEDVPIYVDPAVYREEWLLLSAVLPTETLQVRGEDLRKVFNHVPNQVEEVTTFNQRAQEEPAERPG
jgi:Ala-tRNA(Pro) deacylase